MLRVDLSSKNTESATPWQLKQICDSETECKVEGWIAATVPGQNFTDLMKAGVIEDPFDGENEKDVQWVGEADWVYQRSFNITPELYAAPCLDLLFQGIDTFAEVFLNGQKIGESDNMFREWRFDIKPFAKEGMNNLEVKIEAPLKRADELLGEVS